MITLNKINPTSLDDVYFYVKLIGPDGSVPIDNTEPGYFSFTVPKSNIKYTFPTLIQYPDGHWADGSINNLGYHRVKGSGHAYELEMNSNNKLVIKFSSDGFHTDNWSNQVHSITYRLGGGSERTVTGTIDLSNDEITLNNINANMILPLYFTIILKSPSGEIAPNPLNFTLQVGSDWVIRGPWIPRMASIKWWKWIVYMGYTGSIHNSRHYSFLELRVGFYQFWSGWHHRRKFFNENTNHTGWENKESSTEENLFVIFYDGYYNIKAFINGHLAQEFYFGPGSTIYGAERSELKGYTTTSDPNGTMTVTWSRQETDQPSVNPHTW